MRSHLSAALIFTLFACSPPQPPPPEELKADDAGSEAVDAGAQLPDAGTEVRDAGTEVPDAGTPIDAGTPDAGCRCTAAEYCAAGLCLPDTTDPLLTVTASAGTTSGSLRLSGTASDTQTALTPVEVQVNGTSVGTTAVIAGAWTLQVPAPVGRAEYSVIATVRDAAGNTTSAETTFDTEAPTVMITAQNGAEIDAAASSFSISASVTDGLPLTSAQPAQVRVLDGTTVLVAWTDLVRQANGTWTWTWSSLPQLDFTTLTLEVAATDASSNRGTASLTVLYDRVRPTLTFTPSTNAACTATACTGAIVNAASTTLDLVGLVSPDATLSLRVLDGAAVVMPALAVPHTAGSWSYSWTSFPNVDGRFYSLELTATDTLRNTVTRQLVVLVDRVQPSLLVNAPRQGTLVGTSLVSVNTSVTDGLGLTRVEVGTVATGPFISAVRDSNGDYLAQIPVPTVDAVEQVLTVRAMDLAGNVRTGTTRYTADRVAPVLTLNGTDFNCTGANACTGSVANRASTQVVFGGTFSDGSAVTLQKTIVGPSGTVVSATDAVTGASWSWPWASLPQNVTGAAYELRVIATDAAGNVSAQLVRRTWLDNVAPTVTLPVNGLRNINPLAVLAVFSEPMNAASVVSATSITPFVALTNFGTTDGLRFQFSGAPAPQNYTPQAVSIASALDKAGNASASASATFLTSPTSITYPFVADRPPAGTENKLPRIMVDDDNRFTVGFLRLTTATSATEGHLYRAVGNGSGAKMVLPAGQLPTDLVMTSSVRGADQRLTVGFDVPMILSASSVGVQSWATTWGPMTESYTVQPPTVIGATQPITTATLNSLRPTLESVPVRGALGVERVYRSMVVPNNGATAMNTWNEDPTWSSFSTSTLTNFKSMNGRASVEGVTGSFSDFRVRFWDLGGVSDVVQDRFIRSATAQPAFKVAGSRAGTSFTASSSYVAWTTENELSVACKGQALASTWLASRVTPGPARQFSSPLASAMSPSTFVVATEYAGTVYVYSTPVNGCAAAPVLTEIARVTGARDPGLTIDRNGKVWLATINLLGEVVIDRF